MRYGRILSYALLLTGLILAGCSEPSELAAATKISTKVAQARRLMNDRTKSSYQQAKNLLLEALATKGATSIAKYRAHELLGTLLSESTARELSDLDEKTATKSHGPGDQVESFAEADLGLQRSLSEHSTKAQARAYAAGLTNSNDQQLRQYRKELLGKIPPAEQAKDEATRLRAELEKKLEATEKAAFTTAATADAILLEAAKASGAEQVSKMKVGAAKRLDADRLLISASGEKLVLLRAKEDEIRRVSTLAGLLNALGHVEQLINAHTDMVAKSSLDNQSAQAVENESAKELLKQMEKFDDSGGKLAAAYDRLIAGQSEALRHFEQALRGAAQRGKRFRAFKASQPREAPDDERVQMLLELDAEVSLAVSVARAQISLAGLRQQKIDVLKRVQSRVEQIKQLRAGGLVMDSPRIDITAINQSIQETRQAALEDLNSAVKTLWRTALPRLKADSPPDAVAERLRRDKWNWQVLGMLGIVHEARGRMSESEQAVEDAQTAATYLAESKKARAGVLR